MLGRLLLPRARQLPLEAPIPAAAATRGTVALSILLVDDDADLRELTLSALDEMGHHVRSATGGEEAIGMLGAGDRPDLLIADFAMPGINGATVAAAARRRWADLPILFLTGYAEADVLRDWRDRAHVL